MRIYRLALGLSQEELGESYGVGRTYIGKIEQGRANLSLTGLQRLADFFQVDAVDLLTEPSPADPRS